MSGSVLERERPSRFARGRVRAGEHVTRRLRWRVLTLVKSDTPPGTCSSAAGRHRFAWRHVAGSGLAFDDRGEHELKGVPGVWRVYALRRPS